MVAACPNDLAAEPPIDVVLQLASQSLTYRAKCFFDEASPLVPPRFIPEAVRCPSRLSRTAHVLHSVKSSSS